MISAIVVTISCALAGHLELECLQPTASTAGQVAGIPAGPIRAREALDVVLSAQAAVAWDVASGRILYEKRGDERREVASLVKLLSTLVVKRRLAPETVVEIPNAARRAQQLGAHIKLPIGQHALVQDLLAASLIASANDAIVTLAVAAEGDEGAFVQVANQEAERLGLSNTRLANATGLPGGEQYSTANDVRRLLTLGYADPILGQYLNDARGSLVTTEGQRRNYKSTNDLLATYLPILAAKTGYTVEAGENVALLTKMAAGQVVGIVILGSKSRFHDAKILAEWTNQHYTWP
jgi:D-alanyl-D-alanine carboxypeptidase